MSAIGSSRASYSHPETVTILSCDGGGVRGVIQAVYLDWIEKYTGHSIAALFDYTAGTSIGSFVVSALSVPGEKDPFTPKYTAHQVLDILTSEAEHIFPQGFFSLIRKIGHVFNGGLYDPKGINEVAAKVFGKTEMRKALTEVIVPATKLNPSQTKVFSRKLCNADKKYESLPLSGACIASAAAPVYLGARRLPIANNKQLYLDGGMLMNNPAERACLHAKEDHPNSKIIELSLGTGIFEKIYSDEELKRLGAEDVFSLLDINMKGNSLNVDKTLSEIADREKHKFEYLRLQPNIPRENEALDNSSKENLDKLIKIANMDIIKNQFQLQTICDKILEAKGLTKIS